MIKSQVGMGRRRGDGEERSTVMGDKEEGVEGGVELGRTVME